MLYVGRVRDVDDIELVATFDLKASGEIDAVYHDPGMRTQFEEIGLYYMGEVFKVEDGKRFMEVLPLALTGSVVTTRPIRPAKER